MGLLAHYSPAMRKQIKKLLANIDQPQSDSDRYFLAGAEYIASRIVVEDNIQKLAAKIFVKDWHRNSVLETSIKTAVERATAFYNLVNN